MAFPEGIPLPPSQSSLGVGSSKEKTTKEETKKLKKKRSNADGYESDGGYMSDVGSKKKEKKKDKKKDTKNADEDADGGLSPVEPGERKRKKSFVEVMRSSTKKKDKDKPKDKDSELGYETDGGSKKPKRSFFKLSSKSSKGDLSSPTATTPDEIPSLPTFGLPIHERFNRAIPTSNASFSSSVTATSSTSTATLPPMAPIPAMSFQNFGPSSLAPPIPQVESPTSTHAPPSALSNPNLDLGISKNRDSQVSTESSSSAASRFASSSRTSHSSAGKSHDHNANRLSPVTIPFPSSDLDVTRSVSPAFSTTSLRSPLPDHFALKPVSSPLARAPSPIPSISTAVQEDYPQQKSPQESRSPTSFAPTGKGGLKLRPSLDKLHLLGQNKDKGKAKIFKKDKDEQSFTETLLVPGQTSSALPSPMTPASPYVLVTPIQSSPSTSSSHSVSSSSQPPSNLPQSTSPLPRFRNQQPPSDTRPLSPPVQVTRPLISAPNTAVSPMVSPTATSSAALGIPRLRPTNMALPESPLPSPNSFAYYDIPPASSPPSGPLPVPPREPSMLSTMDRTRSPSPIPMGRRARSPIPTSLPHSGPSSPVANAVQAQFPTPAQLRQRMVDRNVRSPPPSALPKQPAHGASAGSLSGLPIQRGRESPFPSRRVVQPTQMAPRRSEEDDALSPKGKDSRRARFNEDPVTSGGSAESGDQGGRRRSWIDFDDFSPRRSSEESNDEIEIRVSASDDDGVSVDGTQESWVPQGMGRGVADVDDGSYREVIERFSHREGESEESLYSGRALGRSQSFETLQQAQANANASASANPAVDYAWDDKMTVGTRTSRWSGSIYSRISIMDEEESTKSRDQFVKRVEAMLAANNSSRQDESSDSGLAGVGTRGAGRGMAAFVPPPVPRIPDVYANESTNLGRGARAPPIGEPAHSGRNWNKF